MISVINSRNLRDRQLRTNPIINAIVYMLVLDMSKEELVFEHIGDLIDQEMDVQNKKAKEIAEKWHKVIGFGKVSSCQAYIHTVRHGIIYGSTSLQARRKPENLEKLARFYHYGLELKKGHIIVEETKKSDERFEYPPRFSY